MNFRTIILAMAMLLISATGASVAFACSENCKPNEVYSDEKELCVPVQTPLS
mgnify:CR=1 FL=1